MASFKEIKERINSVRKTRKITSAMKMVSAAKLHKAQRNIAGMLPYSRAMDRILASLMAAGEEKYNSPLSEERELRHVALVAFSSDSSLAGAFNSNVGKELLRTWLAYNGVQVSVYTIGKKVHETALKAGINVTRNYEDLAARPDYDPMAELATEFMTAFSDGTLDRVELIYHHFRSAGAQVLTHENFLPVDLHGEQDNTGAYPPDYILEPSRNELIDTLIPRAMKLRLYTTLLDSSASEHAARVIAMQTATDNADDLLNELTVQYNKSRQQAITNELLDMIGGSTR